MTDARWVPIEYRDFWDVPRIFALRYKGSNYLFECQFSDDREDYSDHYTVYRLDPGVSKVLEGLDWTTLPGPAERIGEVDVSAVIFDDTRRRSVDRAVIDQLLGT